MDKSLWKGHAFFGFPGSENDINVLEASPLISNISNGSYPSPVEYIISGEKRNKPYWLANIIYPKWLIFPYSALPENKEGETDYIKARECTERRRTGLWIDTS